MIFLCDVSLNNTGKCLANLGLVGNNYVKEILDSKSTANSLGGIYILATV